MKLGALLEGENFQISDKHLLDREIFHWTERSDEVNNSSWFIAVRGETVDGHNFIPDALRRGASGIIAEKPFLGTGDPVPCVIVQDSRKILSLISSRWFGVPSGRLHLIGVTGTNGKTTITYLIQNLLNYFTQAGLVGTVEARWQDKQQPTINTTPGPRELNAVLNQMVQDGVTACAMEVSSHALKQGRVDDVLFQTAVFTNLTQDHLDYHKTFDDYFESKAKLFLEFPSVTKRIVNLDDAYGKKMWNRLKKNAGISYAINQRADYEARDVQMAMDGTHFVLIARGGPFKVSTKLLCLHNVYNLLAAIATTVEMGYPIEGILEAVKHFDGVPGRLERFSHPNGAAIFVDYAHSPDAFKNIFGSLKPLKCGRIVSVFGCGGNRDRDKRSKMGRIAGEFSDHMIVTSDNPREEDPKEIIREILVGLNHASVTSSLDVIESRSEAIRHALDIARPEDTVLILGKGHENYQIIGKQKFHFSDQEEIQQWIKEFKTHKEPSVSRNLLGV
ncbi:MAG: UDP-N-acetylmuramoyl-L-alanyl-D-glutamate--2,6-diaminopimelate ligase [Candidatus Omnitrophica bacterium]|nr:UDP-N-acetylmuramoyl-L-alanyl-D-glutamate--2,6-diaminopimelate ligase [Candidatus Omnitrophota bacterium]